MDTYTVEDLIPHRGKMRLIDKILDINPTEKSLISQVTITKQDTFFDPTIGGVPAYVSFEYMAQSISALSSLMNNRQAPKQGVILSVSNLSCTKNIFLENSEIHIQVKEDCEEGEILTFDGIASIKGEIIVSCTLMVMEVDALKTLTKRKEVK